MAVMSPQSTAGPFLSPTRGDALKKRLMASPAAVGDKPPKTPVALPPSASPSAQPSSNATTPASNKKRKRLSIGTPGKVTPLADVREREVERTFTEHEVSEVYRTIRKQTGSLGGNAAGGAIYGEITQASFQRVVDYLKENCELSKSSRSLMWARDWASQLPRGRGPWRSGLVRHRARGAALASFAAQSAQCVVAGLATQETSCDGVYGGGYHPRSLVRTLFACV
ncbi:hypothetical protein GQ600_4713 [Phytophthora cactorum]|nr:hypothetical protein GQ600_4713 [Phytophthora cactorum]